ncbi:MAG TPA: DUF456 domain-containing protein [Balneolaceae bacterium]|nr:DUF456 domain-containing protein [Balneolaceae bacterium]
METLLIILGALFILAGIAGAFLPLIPGPPLSYIGLLIVHFTKGGLFSLTFLLIWLVICIVVVTLDGFVPVEGARRMGGSKKGIYGALVGAIAGVIFLPPVGIIFAPIAGAFIGEMFTGRGTRSALRSALGSLAGYLVTIVMKFAVASMMAYYFFTNL